MIRMLVVGVMTVAAAGTAHAQTVSSSSLQDINGTYGAGVATTTTNANGKSTTVIGPAGGANRASGTALLNTWFQSNVGDGGTVGITSTFQRSGNGSAFFSTTNVDSKADLQYYFGSGGALQQNVLSTLASVSYEFLRSSTSTSNPVFAPVLRLDIAKDGRASGSLVFENVYQNQQAAPVDSWTNLTASLSSGIFWATSTALGPAFASANGGRKTLQAWIDGNSGSTLSVYGMSMGVGTGFDGAFTGAEDNVAISFSTGVSRAFNFEVPATTPSVPEPATWAMMIAGFGMVGFAMRRRQKIAVSYAG